MRCFMLFAWTISCIAYDDFGQEWMSQWKQLKSSLESGEIQHCNSYNMLQNICSLQNVVDIEQKNTCNYNSQIVISVHNQEVSCSNAFGFLAIIFDVLRKAKFAREYQEMVRNMSYDDYLKYYNEYVSLEYQIIRLQKLLHVSQFGSFPEQVLARIYLAQTSLCAPYDKICDACTKKLWRLSFDMQGNFVWSDINMRKLYDNFYKKIPQDWRAILLQLKKNSNIIDVFCTSKYAKLVQNEYNQTIIDICYQGIVHNFPNLHKLCRKYFDKLMQSLYDYYIEQQYKKRQLYYEQYDPCFTTIKEGDHEYFVLRDYYYQEFAKWLFCSQSQPIESHILYGILGNKEDILDLVEDEDYQFTLLRKFVDTVCHGSATDLEIQKILFIESGILSKYSNCMYVQKYFFNIKLDDELFHKAVNFALAIQEKEQNVIVQKIAQLVLHYVVLAYHQEENFLLYKKKVEVLYKALSHNQYDAAIFQI